VCLRSALREAVRPLTVLSACVWDAAGGGGLRCYCGCESCLKRAMELQERSPGVYALWNRCRGLFYVGQALDVAERWRVHIARLEAGTHRNRALLRDWAEQVGAGFVWILVQREPSYAHRMALEVIWAERVGLELLYNRDKLVDRVVDRVQERVSRGSRGDLP
jgi:hypothetical protein